MTGRQNGSSPQQAGSARDGAELAWYEEWFDRDEYELVYQARDDRDARALIQLFCNRVDLKPGARILDMACGRGRHALILAEKGFEVTGIDLSPRSIEIAQKRAALAGVEVTFLQGDMRRQRYDSRFDAVVNLFTSFGYFEKEHEHQEAINVMASALKPGGKLFQDFINAEFVHKHLIEEDVRFQGSLEIVQQRRIEDGRLKKRIIMSSRDDEFSFEESVRMFGLADFERMYTRAGLRIRETFGDYHGRPVDVSRPRLILLAERAEE